MKGNSIYNKIKQHKTNIIIIILVLLGLNRCAVGCNRANKLSKSERKIDTLTTTIDHQQGIIDSLNRDITEYQNVIKLYKGFDKDKQSLIASQNKMQEEQIRALRAIQSKINKK